jgi:glycosyltransferase involved in cell wall biosynthesis
MKIAQIAPLYESVPPKFYGGSERIVAYLCDALVGFGHDVTLFAAADARTRAQVVAVRDTALRLDGTSLKSDLGSHLTLLDEVKKRAAEFDVLHFHTDLMHFGMFEEWAYKSITTIHTRLDSSDLNSIYKRWNSFFLVSISDSQREPLPWANWLMTIRHGVPPDKLPFTEVPRGGYLAFLGRISPEKRPDRAIHLARQAGIPLKIAAKVDPVDRSYFETSIKPLLNDPLIEFVGEIGDDRKGEFLGDAAALVFPIDWPEPFGLVMIEAMACGTPVVAWDHGSVPEVVEHGVSGIIVRGEDDPLSAIFAALKLDRRGVRAEYERCFTSRRMAEEYVSAYTALLARYARPRLSGSAS